MAYAGQDGKKVIVGNLKKVIPADWKWSVSVHNHLSYVLTIQSAKTDLIARYTGEHGRTEMDVNHYWYNDHCKDAELVKIIDGIVKAMHSANYYNNTDASIDYFDTAYYINIKFGRWNKPFEVK